MKITRRTLVIGAMTVPLVAQAQTPAWPPSNIRIVVAYPPGGSTDAIMRLVQAPLQDRLSTTVIIENRAGASGSVGSTTGGGGGGNGGGTTGANSAGGAAASSAGVSAEDSA